MCKFSRKLERSQNLAKIWPKITFLAQILKKELWIRNQHPLVVLCANFQENRSVLKIWAKFGLKSPFLHKFWKMTAGFEISTLQLCYVQIFKKIGAFSKFGPNLPKLWRHNGRGLRILFHLKGIAPKMPPATFRQSTMSSKDITFWVFPASKTPCRFDFQFRVLH